MRLVWVIIGGISALVSSFFVTLYILDNFRSPSGDLLRAAHVRSIKAALESYRGARGKYPLAGDKVITELKAELSSYLPVIPQDPTQPGTAYDYRYVSDTGDRYGLFVHLQNGDPCITGVSYSNTGWWLNPPSCPF